MDWRTLPSFMPQAIPTMQQAAYSAPPHTGGWTTTTHASSIAFQQPTNVAIQSQGVGYSNGFSGAQQFKKAMVPGVQFGHHRLGASAYGQAGPMPIVGHRGKATLNSNAHGLLPPTGHDGNAHGDVDGLHSLVPVKSEASDIIEVWESKGRFSGNLGGGAAGHGSPWLQGPGGRVTIKSEPVEVGEVNPWDTAKSVPAFPTNLPSAEGAGWHSVSDVSSVPLGPPAHYGVGYVQDPTNRGSCSKKDLSAHPGLNIQAYANAAANMSMNHGMPPPPGGANKAMNSTSGGGGGAGGDSSADMVSDQHGKMKGGGGVGGLNVKCGLEGVATSAHPEGMIKKKKEKKGPPIPCKQCGKEFSKSYMKKHIRSHAEMKPFVCSTCNKVFYSAALLAEHESAYHDEDKKHQCYVCGHRFHQKSLLKEHLKTHVEKPYKCRVCPRSFSRRIKLNNHEKLHEGAQLKQCDICGKLLKGRVSLKCHMHNMHSETRKKYPCIDCGRIFLLERSLTTHRYVVHTGERPFKCPDCGRAFADIKYLKSHLLIHTGEKPYQCNVCGKRFRQSTALWCHKTTHTGIKPHRCPDCGRQSVHRSELAKHKCAARREQQQPVESPHPVQNLSSDVPATTPAAP